jgi:uncharacterized damage-inducible protein DinB
MCGEKMQQTNEFKNRELLTRELKKKDVFEMETLFKELQDIFKTFIEKQKDFNQLLKIEHPIYGYFEISYVQLIRHLVNHGTYHRGNIASMLLQLMHQGIATDYFVYLCQK